MKIWLCLYFQHVKRYIGTDFVEESRQKMQRSEEEHCFREGCFDRKEYISNTANKRCSRQVLQLPMFFVISHQILNVALGDELYYSVWALNGGIDLFPCPKVPSKGAYGLGPVHCQRGTFGKLRTSCPCEVEFEVVLCFLWRRLTCPQNSSLRMFWHRDLTSSHFFPRFGALKHEANRTPDISVTFIGSRKKFCKRKRMSVGSARKRKPNVLSVSHGLNRFNWCSRGRTTPLQILCQNMDRMWYWVNFNQGENDIPCRRRRATDSCTAPGQPWVFVPAPWSQCPLSRGSADKSHETCECSARRGSCQCPETRWRPSCAVGW